MSEVKNSILSAVAVVAAAGSVVAGISVRSHNDLGGTAELPGNPAGYLASKDNTPDVPASDYFFELSEKLKKEYVEPVKDDQKLAVGAVRGMITSLADPKSLYLGTDEFHALLNARQGKYEGVGVDLALMFNSPGSGPTKNSPQDSDSNETSAEEALALGFRIPRVVVTTVVPGGPADKAGVKVGDSVYAVDGHWVANLDEVIAFRKAQSAYLEKKLSSDAYMKLRNDIRKKTERALMPMKVLDKLAVGGSGAIDVTWTRDGKQLPTRMERAHSIMPGFSVTGATIRLPFREGDADRLKQAIVGKKQITIDLRNNVNGDFEMMRQCLAKVAPAGKYGTIANERKDKGLSLSVPDGNPSPPAINLLVDKSTAGAAEIFALALSSKGRAKLVGSEMGPDRSVKEIVQLPDGSGYTLVTGVYRTQDDVAVVAKGGK